MALFKKGKDSRAISEDSTKRKSIPPGLWTKCPQCQNIFFNKVLRENLSVCGKCSYHFIIGAQERIEQLIDPKTFREINPNLTTLDPLNFKTI